jgi:hypothetical protein
MGQTCGDVGQIGMKQNKIWTEYILTGVTRGFCSLLVQILLINIK